MIYKELGQQIESLQAQLTPAFVELTITLSSFFPVSDN